MYQKETLDSIIDRLTPQKLDICFSKITNIVDEIYDKEFVEEHFDKIIKKFKVPIEVIQGTTQEKYRWLSKNYKTIEIKL